MAVAFACLGLLGTTGSAQAPAEPAAPQSELMLTGCLERATEGDAKRRLIFHSRAGEQQAGAHTGAASTTVRRYLVEGDEDLQEHAGQRVRLTGHVKVDTGPDRRSNAGITPSLPSGGTGMETIPRPTDTPRDAQDADKTPATDSAPSTFVVTEVETLAATCPQGGS